MTEEEKLDQIKKEISRVHESVMYSQQTQFEYSKTWRRIDRWVGGLSAGLAAIAAAGGLSDVFSAQLAGVVALAAAGVGAVAPTFGASESKDRAAASAGDLLALQQDARILLNIDLVDMALGEAREALANLVDRQRVLNSTCEVPSNRAWKRAKRNVEKHLAQEYAVDRADELIGKDDV